MPYLIEKDKKSLDSDNCLSYLSAYLNTLSIQDFAGALNCLNFIIVKRWIKQNGKKYFIFATIVGTLICCILEIYRRLISPYEDKKIQFNGDAV